MATGDNLVRAIDVDALPKRFDALAAEARWHAQWELWSVPVGMPNAATKHLLWTRRRPLSVDPCPLVMSSRTRTRTCLSDTPNARSEHFLSDGLG